MPLIDQYFSIQLDEENVTTMSSALEDMVHVPLPD
jgi:hypothetical protein